MSEIRVKFAVFYIIAIIVAYSLKKITMKIAKTAIKEKKLTTGIYSLFPVDGERAVELAKGYINGSKIVFWFVVIFFPLIFILSML